MPTRNGMRPVHPGEILREEFLMPSDLSADLLSIVKEEVAVTAETALLLSEIFGTTRDFWMNLQSDFEARISGC